MRHAKAEPTGSVRPRAGPARPAAARDAEAVGRWLATHGDRPRRGPGLRRPAHPADLGAGRRRRGLDLDADVLDRPSSPPARTPPSTSSGRSTTAVTTLARDRPQPDDGLHRPADRRRRGRRRRDHRMVTRGFPTSRAGGLRRGRCLERPRPGRGPPRGVPRRARREGSHRRRAAARGRVRVGRGRGRAARGRGGLAASSWSAGSLRRVAGEPLETVLGWVEFLGLPPGRRSPVCSCRARRTGLLARTTLAHVPTRRCDRAAPGRRGDVLRGRARRGAPRGATARVEVHAADVSAAALSCARSNVPAAEPPPR